MIIQQRIEKKLTDEFSPSHLEVINESHMHNVPKGSESHFKVIVVSETFENKRLIARHRAINTVLADELKNDIHALAMHTYTDSEWREANGAAPDSPQCQGGSKL
ncbi:BolA family transcriptional regulator [Veronia nyctiphanis]|uniref:DNA-binding transcriptional regulator BolA n=1 Tax=Veronia nyctiphanis TaxID=1278244 RepID=A0A4Q0YPQ9_9GAMM|nr:transcriptional regulator BolA [Veronia nyctiphanis]RXJ72956.1 BolA family transcriptional regulator [Veronia nyctiphanis]